MLLIPTSGFPFSLFPRGRHEGHRQRLQQRQLGQSLWGHTIPVRQQGAAHQGMSGGL